MIYQWWAVAIVLIGAVSYAGYRIYKAFTRTDDPCCGCNGCELKEACMAAKKKNKGCCHKKIE